MNLQPGGMAPHSQEMEEAVLSVCAIHGDQFVTVKDQLEPDDFFILRHGYIWKACQSLHQRGMSIEYLTIIEELKNVQIESQHETTTLLDTIGGAAFISYLVAMNAQNIQYWNLDKYVQTVKELSIRRKMLEAAAQQAQLALDTEKPMDAVQHEAQVALDDAFGTYTADRPVGGWDAMENYIGQIEARMDGADIPGIPSGLSLDDLLVGGGFQSGFWAVVGFTHKGKTTLETQIAYNMAKAGYQVGFWTPEMEIEELQHKLLTLATGVDADKLFKGLMTREQLEGYKRGKDELLYKGSVFPQALRREGVAYHTSRLVPIMSMFTFYDNKTLTCNSWSKMARDAHRRGELDAAFVDGLQIMLHVARHKDETYAKSIGQTVREMQATAKTLGIPVLAGVQANRESQRSSNKTALYHIADSSDIEKNSDGVLFIDDDGEYNTEDLPPVIRKKVVINKQRFPGGKLGTRFYDLTLQTGKFEPVTANVKVNLDDF